MKKGSTERFVLREAGIKSFSDIKIPSEVRFIDLSNNQLFDFIGFKNYLNLTEIILDGNPILSFNGFPKLLRLKNISIKNSPISKLPNFRHLLLIAAGNQLEKINGEDITLEDRAAAISYGNISSNYNFVSKGWLPSQPKQFVAVESTNTSSDKNNEISYSIKSQNQPNKYQPKSKAPEISMSKLIEIQQSDPISVRAVRLMKQTGETDKTIGQFLCDYLTPKETQHNSPKKSDSTNMNFKQILDQNAKTINELSIKRQAIISKNQNLERKYVDVKKFEFYNEAKKILQQYTYENAEITDEKLNDLLGMIN